MNVSVGTIKVVLRNLSHLVSGGMDWMELKVLQSIEKLPKVSALASISQPLRVTASVL